ncbi:MAG: Fe-S protein assembly co-chaperone HscB [Gammaproteobacteria bacterium]|nr:Fe-S protein assembly co-chaperone HscB [Gammaproteobacteria bacterium]
MAVESSSSHFELFGLPRSFGVDRQLLDAHYRELQRTVHPDRFVNATDTERRLSAQQATRINEGYQTLKDPLLRGRYLLELAGIDHNDEHRTTRDARFLMEQMDLRETLSGVRDAANVFAALEEIMDRIGTELDNLTAEVSDLLERGDADSLAGAGEALMKMQFYRRLQDEAVELEVELEDELA